jgi:1,4-alpha-glucan branching enzyme
MTFSSPTTAVVISCDDLYLFNEGAHAHLYRKMGAQPVENEEGLLGFHFAVWAPNAKTVALIGDFNDWNPHSHPLSPLADSGIWAGFLPQLDSGALYKYHIVSHDGSVRQKADPFAFYHEKPPTTASITRRHYYQWRDQAWMQHRQKHFKGQQPLAIYEVHLGSWRRAPEENNRWLTYREIAPLLTAYVKEMGFTHVELLPVMEHPYYGSWGYQTTGYFAPSSRYGTPEDFMFLIDTLHQQNIGVILDWTPSHFPTDAHGLAHFDGTHLYEHADPRRGFHPDWKSAIFNYGRHEVRSFLQSSALFWLDIFHADGLRVDAVASMLYLDYSRKNGEWLPNTFGGRENIDAIHFLQQLNEKINRYYPDVHVIAEESTAWSMVSRPVDIGGLGFGYKWDMGWMHDSLQYLQHDPIYRRYHHQQLTFRMLYAFNENFILPLSHDEVVHGKGSLLSKMPGDDWQKMANCRLLFGYQYAQPGKKLLFMGMEFGQWEEWGHDTNLSWHLTQYAPHQGLQRWVQTLNQLYRQETALHSTDTEPSGFEWIDCDNDSQSIISFLRRSSDGQQLLLIIVNATPMTYFNYRIGIPRNSDWHEIANSDSTIFGGSGQVNANPLIAESIAQHGQPFSLNLTIPPLGVIFLKPGFLL